MIVSPKQRRRFLDESIFFHHFMAIAAAYQVIREADYRRVFCDEMVAAIKPGEAILSGEDFGLPSTTILSRSDLEEAVKRCFFAFPAMTVGSAQELYLRNEPSEAEREIMNLKTVQEATGWGSPARTVVHSFTAAFFARLCVALDIDPKSGLGFFKLLAYSAATSLSTFQFYVEMLGAEIVQKDCPMPPEATPVIKRNWFSRLFR